MLGEFGVAVEESPLRSKPLNELYGLFTSVVSEFGKHPSA